MRYASERLSLFRTVFVQVAALLLFAAGWMLLTVAVNAADFLEAYSQLGQDQRRGIPAFFISGGQTRQNPSHMLGNGLLRCRRTLCSATRLSAEWGIWS